MRDKKQQLKKSSHIIEINVKTGKHRQVIIEKVTGRVYEIALRSFPFDNKANIELLLLLSNYFKVNLNDIHIVSGLRSKKKLIKIDEHLS